jgi:uncharacterized protein YqjF (DUF2071 family)
MHCETYSIQNPIESSSEAARERLLSVKGEPLFLADWVRPVFVHYEVPAEELQSEVPFEIDLFEGKAYVSLVAFTMRRMRPFIGGPLGAWLFKPIARNDYLNVRTYIRHRNELGIYFLAEWMNNRFSVRLGPWTFGLPYRFGNLNYRHQHESGIFNGIVCEKPSGPSFAYCAEAAAPEFAPCPAGSLDEFLLERYTAFTAHGTKRRFFRIWHPHWMQKRIKVSVTDTRLLINVWPWFADAKPAGGNYSPGAQDVLMGRPHRIED